MEETKVKLGIIGGSGAKGVVEALGSGAPVERVYVWKNGYGTHIETIAPSPEQVGHSPDSFSCIVDYYHFTHGQTEVYFVLRHGRDHTDLPARVDQRGMIHLLKDMGVDGLVLASATGSLDTAVKLVDEGGMVVNSNVFRGFGYQGVSFNDPKNPHAVMAEPFHHDMRGLLLESIGAVSGAAAFDGGLYVHNTGNAFETPGEIADLVCRLDEPSIRLRQYRLERILIERGGLVGNVEELDREIALYERLAEHLNRRYAQVSMNAGREAVLAQEAGIARVGLVAFPVNYGAGLVPAEKVDHERTINAISKATEPYIVPFFLEVIRRAPEYVKRQA